MKDTFSQETINKVDNILKVQYLGVKEFDIVETTNKTTEKIIVFNHRPEDYKDFNNFMSIVDELREQRQDFKVWIPLLRNPNRDFVLWTNMRRKSIMKNYIIVVLGFHLNKSMVVGVLQQLMV